MTDDTTASEPTPEESESARRSAEPSVSASWDDVMKRMGELGDAIGGWARAAADDAENRKHLEQVRQGLNDMSAKAAETFAEVAQSDFGKSVAQGASQAGAAIGEAAQNVGQAAAPHVASAFAGLADAFGTAARKVSESTAAHSAPAAPASPAAPAEPDATPEPPDGPVPAPGEDDAAQ